MRGTVAKRLSRKIYGVDGSPRHREYSTHISKHFLQPERDPKTGKLVVDKNGNVMARRVERYSLVAGPQRALYQNLKKQYKREHNV